MPADPSIYILREFVNYCHPGPRRVWKVGPELQSTTLDPVNPLMSSKLIKTRVLFRSTCLLWRSGAILLLTFEWYLTQNDRFGKKSGQDPVRNVSKTNRFAWDISQKVTKQNVARYSNSRFAYARQHFASKNCVSSTQNVNFALEAEARALEKPRPAKTLTWRRCTHGMQTNLDKFYISKLPIHRHRTAVTRTPNQTAKTTLGEQPTQQQM